MIARIAALFIVAVALTACGGKPQLQRLPDLNFSYEKPINLDVAQVEIKSDYVPPGHLPNYEHLMPISPEAAAIIWAKDRLRPQGKTGFIRVEIKDARVIKTDLRLDESLSAKFREQQAERYDAWLEVSIELLDARHLPTGTAVTARANHTRSLPEGATVNERDRALYDVTEALARDIDTQMDGLIRNYMGPNILP